MNEHFEETKRGKIINSISVFFICTIILMSVIMVQVSQNKKNNIDKSIVLNNNWIINIDNKNTENVDLDNFVFKGIKKNSIITLKTRLPNINVYYPLLDLKTYYCNVKCYVDSECIYQLSQTDASGKTFDAIELDKEYSNKIFTIELTALEDNAFSNIKAPEITGEMKASSQFAGEHVIEVGICVFLLMLGILIVGIAILRGEYKQKNRKLLWIGLLSVAFSLWLMSFLDILYLITDNNKVVSFFEYLNLLFVVQATILYFCDSFIDKFSKKIFLLLFFAGTIIFVFAFVSNNIGLIYYSFFLKVINVYSIFSLCTVSHLMYSRNIKEYKSNKIALLGVVVLIFIGIIGVIRKQYIKNHMDLQLISIMFVFFALLFIFSITMSYVEYLKEHFNETAESLVLTQMAYQDMLTGIANRAKCKEYMNSIKIDKNNNISLVYFDLNYLKVINDTMGHMRGDNYICEFARLLEESFGESGLVGRIGGDEFIAINKIDNEDAIKDKINNMINMAAKGENPNIGMKISFAYGYALSSKEECNSIYELEKKADKRMYECKFKQKAGRK